MEQQPPALTQDTVTTTLIGPDNYIFSVTTPERTKETHRVEASGVLDAQIPQADTTQQTSINDLSDTDTATTETNGKEVTSADSSEDNEGALSTSERQASIMRLVATGVGAVSLSFLTNKVGVVPDGVAESMALFGFVGVSNRGSNAQTREIGERAWAQLFPQEKRDPNTGRVEIDPITLAPLQKNPYDSADRWITAKHRQNRPNSLTSSLSDQQRMRADALTRNRLSQQGTVPKGYRHNPSAAAIFPFTTTPSTSRMERLELGVKKHANRATELEREAKKFEDLYGDVLMGQHSKSDLNAVLSGVNMTRKEKRAVRSAWKTVHHARHTAHKHIQVVKEVRDGNRSSIPKIAGPRLYWTK